eukprot:7377200-Prymnesium_polylepis.1
MPPSARRPRNLAACNRGLHSNVCRAHRDALVAQLVCVQSIVEDVSIGGTKNIPDFVHRRRAKSLLVKVDDGFLLFGARLQHKWHEAVPAHTAIDLYASKHRHLARTIPEAGRRQQLIHKKFTHECVHLVGHKRVGIRRGRDFLDA